MTFVMDGRANNVPLSGDLSAVTAIVQALRPVTADMQVFAPGTVTQNFGITGMVPNDAGTQANVRAQLAGLIATVAPGGAEVGDGVTAAAPGGHLYLSQIEAAIQAAGNIQHFDLTSPTMDVVYATYALPEMGAVTFS
jgi:uncharacterized phage protein gp47/JayE